LLAFATAERADRSRAAAGPPGHDPGTTSKAALKAGLLASFRADARIRHLVLR